jgi:4-amino-4-deoxy-L-arabinose transferase-like glycosyltransferase
MSASDSSAPVLTSRLAWPAGLRPFRAVVRPGTGPRLDLDRDWPELAFIALAVLLFWRAATPANAPDRVGVAARAILHPIFGLSAALLGVTDGARYALLVGLLAAAGGMWWLGVVLGLGRPGRLWASLAYALAGGVGVGWLTGRFGLDLGYPWIPWALACAILAVRWRRRLYAAGAAAALALIFLGGDFGLTCATLAVLALFLLVAATSLRRERPYIALRRDEALIAVLIGLLGFGLAAVQLLPQLAAVFAGALAVRQAPVTAGLGHLLGTLIVGPGGQATAGGLYAYFGVVPFLYLAGLPMAMRRANRRMLLGLGLLVALCLLWAAGDWLSRTGASAAILAWGAVALLALAGLGFDALWRWSAANLKLRRTSLPAAVRWAAAWLGIFTLAALAAASVVDLYWKNRPPSSAASGIFLGLTAGDLLRTFAVQHPMSLGIGAVLSTLSLLGLALLIVAGLRSRRSQPDVEAVDADGVPRPGEPLDIPDGTPAVVSPSAEPWRLPAWQASFLLLFALMVGIVLFLRLFKLGTLGSEIYGDIVIVRNYVQGVLAGKWPVRFDLSAGPLYHYLIAPIVAVAGLDYAGLKLASVFVSLGVLAATYAFSRRLVNDYFALLTTFIAGVSSWLLIFSRLGNSQILLPLLTAAALWLVARVVQFNRQSDLVACAIVSALGLYVYPQSFVLPGAIFLTLLLLRWTGFPVTRKKLGLFVVIVLVCAIPFVLIVGTDPANFSDGYIGSKMKTGGDVLTLLGYNVVKALLAFNVRGDESFRSNPSGLAQLDQISGVLFLVGMAFWFATKERRRWVPIWLVSLLVLQVPSILALNQPREVPSASRTLGIAPIVYMLVASGLWWLIQAMRARGRRWPLIVVVTGILLGGILYLNVQRYFTTYIGGLPYQDTPIGRLIADYADALPADTQVYMVGCCWEHSIPDRFVDKEVARPQNWHYVDARELSCLQLQFLQSPAVLIWSFHDALPAPQLEACAHWLPAQLFTYQDHPTFRAAPLRPDLPPPSAGTGQIAESVTGLDAAPVEVDGQTVDLVYSKLDMGRPEDIFDGDVSTLARGLEANPFVLEFHFPEPRSIRGLSATFASMDFVVTAKLFADEHAEPKVYTQEFRGLPPDPQIEMAFDDAPSTVRKLRLEVLQLQPPTDVHIHVRELKFR